MGVSLVGVNAYPRRPDNMPTFLRVTSSNACVFMENKVGTTDQPSFSRSAIPRRQGFWEWRQGKTEARSKAASSIRAWKTRFVWHERAFCVPNKWSVFTLFEPTQEGNPHRLTVNQHVFPRASIQRFTDTDGFVEIFLTKQKRLLRLKSNNPIFCAQRAWDQKTEAGVGKRIEDRFQALACAIERGTVATIGILEKRIVEEFFSLWRTRQRFRLNRLQDIHLNGIAGEALTKDQQEIMERKHVMYAVDGVMSGRLLASVHVFGYQDRFVHANKSTQWGIARSYSDEFIVPDCFDDMMIVPISPRIAIVADLPDLILRRDQVAVVNQTAIARASDYYFARRLAVSPVVRDISPPFDRRLDGADLSFVSQS
jgi:hypothetical protein